MKKLFLPVILLFVGLFLANQASAYCYPGPLTRNPSPIIVGSGGAGAKTATSVPSCVSTNESEYTNNQEKTFTLNLKKGSYWLAANGCVRVNRIQLTVTGSGKEVAIASGGAPSTCFSVPADGAYVLKIKANTGSNSYGNINYCVSASGCK